MPPIASTSSYVPTLLPNYNSRPIRRSAKACELCRKNKSRCNGMEMYPCQRCSNAGVICEWQGERPVIDSSRNVLQRSTSPSGSISTIQVDTLPYSLETRLSRMEQELNVLRTSSNLQANQIRTLELTTTKTNSNSTISASTSNNGILSLPLPGSSMSLNDPIIELTARRCFDEFFSVCQTWAPCISVTEDTFDNLRIRSPILMYAILAISSRFQDNSVFTLYCEEQGLKFIRATLYSNESINLDQLKATVIWNAWLGKSSPPGHSLTLALSLGVDTSLNQLLKSVDLNIELATAAFEKFMPSFRTWCSLYSQDLWLSVASGRRSLVAIDYSLISARSLMKFAMLTPRDTRIIAQAELVTILASVQEIFSKTQLHTVDATLEIITQADEKLDAWRVTWETWANSQDTETALYMSASFLMQFSVGRFYVNTLCLSNITQADQITDQQMPCIQASINSALQIQTAAALYGSDRLRHSTEFTLVSVSSGALFLLKMIKLLPSAVNIPVALAAVHVTSNLLISAPIKQYHFAVASAYSHLGSQLSSDSIDYMSLVFDLPTAGLDENVLIGGNNDLVFDPELELALSSVISTEGFWTWEQSLPSDSFASVLS